MSNQLNNLSRRLVQTSRREVPRGNPRDLFYSRTTSRPGLSSSLLPPAPLPGIISPPPMRDLKHHLFLLKELVKRDFRGRYAGSLLGFVWSFVQPLWMLVLFTFVFSTVMRIRLTGAHTQH